MRANWDHLLFELRYHFRRPSFWLIAFVFGAFGFIDVVSNATRGNAYFFVNSPSQIFQTTIWYTLFSVLAATAFVAETFVRDSRCGIEPLILSTPVSRFHYLGMRFLAALSVAVLGFSCYLPGMMLGSLVPGLNPFAIGPLRWDAFAVSYFLITLPNLFWVSVFAFVLASRFRSLIAAYVGAIVLVMLYIAAMLMVGVEQIDYELLQWWTLFDPYGYFAMEASTLSWTVHQHNYEMPTLGGLFLTNRLLWIGIAIFAGLVAYWRFDMRPTAVVSRSATNKPEAKKIKPAQNKATVSINDKKPRATPGWLQLGDVVWFELRFILRSRAFQLLMFCGLVSLLFAASGSSSFEYSNPSTDILIFTASMYFDYVLFAIVVFYAAELMWRDSDCGIQQVIDAMPVPSWLMMLGKLFALFAVVVLNLFFCMLVLMLYQSLQGYYQFEIGLSALMLFGVHGPYFFFVAVLALFCQALTRHKYGGILLTVAVALSPVPLDAFGLYHNLLQFGDTNELGYSPMNGFGGLLTGHWWYTAYWAAFCGVLLLLSAVFWPRGATPRLTGFQNKPGLRWAVGANSLVFLLVGAWIAFNTMVVNPYQPPGKDLLAVEHEKRFKQYENLPMPVVVETDLKVDLYPAERYFLAKGKYVLENQTQQPINEIHISGFINLDIVEAKAPGATLTQSWPEWGYHIYTLNTPIQPGAKTQLEFVTRTRQPEGFRNQSNADDVYMIAPNDVVENGSSLYSPFILPFIGYTKMVEHKEAWQRHKHGLPELDSRMRAHDDPVGLTKALTVSHLTWGSTNVIVGTADEQMVVSSGKEVERWQKGERNYVRYQSKDLNRGKFTLYSGKYGIARNHQARVPVTAFYHAPHMANVESMMGHLANALTYYEEAFGPYPYDEVRLAEFAYYPGMVFSEGGTIGLPEVLGWKADLTGEGEDAMVGWISYLLAHVWWEDQIIVADVAGGMSVREALSGYASNLYRQQIYDDARYQRVKQKQLRDYFRALGQVDFVEPALDNVYNEVLPARFKGQMVLEQIESQIGRPALLAAIGDFHNQFKGKPAPYATLPDLTEAIVQHTPPNLRGRVAELFESVITYRFGVLDAVAQLGESGYQVELMVEAQKLYTRELGEQKPAVMDWPLTLVVEDREGNVIYESELLMTAEQQSIELNLAAEPFRVRLDPNLTLPGPITPNRDRRVRVI